MTLNSVAEFVAEIERIGELVRVSQPVSVVKEIAEIADRCMKSRDGGPALLFEKPILADGTESSMPVAINLFGSMNRMRAAFGVDDLDGIAQRIEEMIKLKVPESWIEKIAMLPKIAELAKFPPSTIKSGAPCQSVVMRGEDVDLNRLPIITCWPGDGGPYITILQVITRDPVSGVRIVGM